MVFCSGSETCSSRYPNQGDDYVFLPLLRSEIPSGVCAKLRTVAATNNRVHMPWSLYYCFFAPLICMVLFFTHMPFVVNHTINATPPERLQHPQCFAVISRSIEQKYRFGSALSPEESYPQFGNCWSIVTHQRLTIAVVLVICKQTPSDSWCKRCRKAFAAPGQYVPK